MGKPKTNNIDRERIISAYNKNENFIQLAYQLNIKKHTAYGIIRTYKNENRIERKHSSNNKPILSEDMVKQNWQL